MNAQNTLELVIKSVKIEGLVNGQTFKCTSIEDITRYIENQYARLKTDESRAAMLAGFAEGKIAPDLVAIGPIPEWVLELQKGDYFVVTPEKEISDNNRITNYRVALKDDAFFKKADLDHIRAFIDSGLIAVSYIDRVYDEEIDAERTRAYVVRKAQERKAKGKAE